MERARSLAGVFRLTGVEEDALQRILDGPEERPAKPKGVGFLPSDEGVSRLRSIDERLQALVPEREWESNSIRTFDDESFSWVDSRTSRADAAIAAPGDPALREQFEKRSAERSMVDVQERLVVLAARAPEAASRQELHALLIDAAQQEVPMPVDEKLRSLVLSRPALEAAEEVAEALAAETSAPLLAEALQALTTFEDDLLDLDIVDDLPPPSSLAAVAALEAELDSLEAGVGMLEGRLAATPMREAEDTSEFEKLLEEDDPVEVERSSAPIVERAAELPPCVDDPDVDGNQLWEAFLKLTGSVDDHWRPDPDPPPGIAEADADGA